jgi:hypothetical protein
MDLVNALKGAAGADALNGLAAQFGLEASAVEQVLDQVVPALGRGIQKNTAAPGGFESLLGALQGGRHERYLGDLASVTSAAGISDGNKILGHVLGNKDVSRNVAAQAAQNSGVSSDVIKQLLPMVATMVMGTLSKQSSAHPQVAASAESGLGGMLGSLLDSDGDGSAVDDILGMAKKFF